MVSLFLRPDSFNIWWSLVRYYPLLIILPFVFQMRNFIGFLHSKWHPCLIPEDNQRMAECIQTSDRNYEDFLHRLEHVRRYENEHEKLIPVCSRQCVSMYGKIEHNSPLNDNLFWLNHLSICPLGFLFISSFPSRLVRSTISHYETALWCHMQATLIPHQQDR